MLEKKGVQKNKVDNNEKSREVARIKIRDDTCLVFSIAGKEKDYVDIRTYIDREYYTGFTKKGIRFHYENLEDFKESLAKAEEIID